VLTGPGPFSFLRSRRALEAHGGFQVMAAEPRHLRRARQIVAGAPVMNVHVGATLPIPPVDREPGVFFWAILDGPRTIGIVQQHRGMCWAVEPQRRGDPRLAPTLADVLARQIRFGEIIFGPEVEVRATIDCARARGIDLVEIRRQEMMACPVPRSDGSPPTRGFVLRPAARRDLKWLLHAHGAMCREDLGVDQVARNPEGYARYFQDLIRRRRMFIGEVDNRPVFKAEIALESRGGGLIGGVFPGPAARGRGHASLATLWLSELALSRGGQACLYVHRRNETAIRVYRRIGFETVSPWATAIMTRDGRRSVRAVEY
jgi:predicted GNAT family acetyltransferase